MCGIAGLLRGRRTDIEVESVLPRMTDSIAHRGPDDDGAWFDLDCGVGLGHRRLSILDLSPLGHQPMHSAAQRFVIVYNGEIYNFLDLRRELEGAGSRFRGSSDTEVLLAAVELWGVRNTLERLNGIFAFALWDRRERQLTLARDHLGVKPLYFGWIRGSFAFASELRALKELPGFAREVDRDALTLLLRYNCIPAPHSIYRQIRKLPAGCLVTVGAGAAMGQEIVTPYWSVREVAERGMARPFEGDEVAATDELERVLRNAVERQMVSDVPLGAFLSGGVDSSTVVALMQSQRTDRVKTFSLGFRELAYDEAAEAAAVAAHLGTDHTQLIVTPDEALAVIPRLPSLYDEPFADSSQIPTFLVCELARREVTVALSGDGGDELFAGYNRHVHGQEIWNRMRRVPTALRRAVAGGMRAVPPRAWDGGLELARRTLPHLVKRRKMGYHAHKLAAVLAATEPLDLYRGFVSHWERPDSVVLGAREPLTLPFDRLRPTFPDLTNEMMALDLETYLADDILVKVDRASMAVGLEARVPLLDREVVEFAWRLPLSLKVRAGRGKFLLREVLYRHVPRRLIDRPKAGFGIPIDAWLRGPLRPWAEDLLDPRGLREDGFFDATAVTDLWKAHISQRTDAQYLLWDVLMFQAWYRHG